MRKFCPVLLVIAASVALLAGCGNQTKISPSSGLTDESTSNAITTTKSKSDTLIPAVMVESSMGGVRYMEYVMNRSKMSNSVYKLLHQNQLTVAYIGGSVTDGTGASSKANSWRSKVSSWLQEAYPDSEITSIAASVGGTGSGFGMYRFDRDVMQYNPDLVFIEFAVNDFFENYSEAQIKTQIETIYRKIYAKNPYADIMMVYVSDESYDSDRTIPWQETIASAYQINSIRLDEIISETITNTGKNFWTFFSDGVHPNDTGYAVYADALITYLQSALRGTSSARTAKTMPKTNIVPLKMNATLYQAANTEIFNASGWTVNKTTFSWIGNRYGGCITTSQQGASFTLKFKGTDFGLLWEMARDIGDIEYSIDGGNVKTIKGYLSYTNPKHALLANDLQNGEHTITIRFMPTATGKRCAISAFLVAGTINQ